MIRIFSTSILLFTTLLCFAQTVKKINFADSSWDLVLQRAKKEGKSVFLYAYTPSCRFCAQMEKDVFVNEAVADFYNSTFISHKINIEDGAEGAALAKKYAIVGFPTYLYFNRKGELLHQSGSAKPATEFLLDGQNATNPQKALFSLKRRYNSGERSAVLLYNYSNALSYYHQKDSPEEIVVAEYLKTQSVQQLASEKNLHYIFDKQLSFVSPATQYFLQNQHKFTPLYNEEEVKRKAEQIVTRTARVAGNEGDLGLLKEVDQAIEANFTNTNSLSSLAKIYFYQGQKEWLKYAEATMEYGREHAGNDWKTLHEAAIYLKHFSDDKQALEIGAIIMEKVISMHKSYDNIFLYAQLQQKAGREDSALEAAREAAKVANEAGQDSSQAESFISQLLREKEK